MPMYFLDVVADGKRAEDLEGEDYSSVEDARAEARLAIREIVGNDVREGKRLGLERRIDIRDAQGQIVASIAFTDVVVM